MIFCGQRCCVGLAVLSAFLVGLVFKVSSIPPNIVIDVLSPSEPPVPVRSLTPDEIASYKRDGVLLVRTLLSQRDAAALAAEADGVVSSRAPWTLLDLFGDYFYSKVLFDAWRTSEVFASLVLRSLPAVASQLVDASVGPSSPDSDSRHTDEVDEGVDGKIRLLRDAYFSFNPDNRGCGWHVDDEGFWPTHRSASGLTVWIALDPMRFSEGGGLATVNATEMLRVKGKEWVEGCKPERTCGMEEDKPECHAGMEEFKLQWDMEPGDAILWDRWTYHRGVPMVQSSDGSQLGGEDGRGEKRRRYSVRYMPAHSRAMGVVHASVQQGSAFNSPYYPQVWPNLVEEEVEALRTGLEGDATLLNVFRLVLPIFKFIRKEREEASASSA